MCAHWLFFLCLCLCVCLQVHYMASEMAAAAPAAEAALAAGAHPAGVDAMSRLANEAESQQPQVQAQPMQMFVPASDSNRLSVVTKKSAHIAENAENAGAQIPNSEEIDIDMDDDEEEEGSGGDANMGVVQKQVPAAVFGRLAEAREAEAGAGGASSQPPAKVARLH